MSYTLKRIMKKLKQILDSPYIHQLRPRQYAKNVFIFAPLFFDGQLFNSRALLRTFLGFITLCLLSSAVYVLNDLVDVEADRAHPQKKYRPIASGKISIRSAKIYCACLFAAALLLAFLLSSTFGLLCIFIALLNVAYSFKLKHIPILDVMTIGILFCCRVLSGAILIGVQVFSPWLYLVTFMLALYLGFGKRRAELASLETTISIKLDEFSNAVSAKSGDTKERADELVALIKSRNNKAKMLK